MLKQFCLVLAFFALAACSGPRLPFEKDLPTNNTMVAPPWEAFVKAGPGAENELDLETLDGPRSAASVPPTLTAEAEVAGQDRVESAPAPVPEKPAKKGGIAIKAVAVPLVQGAKGGKGNSELTEAMRKVLREAGWSVVNAPAPDALTIRGKVQTAAAAGGAETVKLKWVITTPEGKTLGDISQANDVPAGSLDGGWGENARFATEAAAEGIFKLIEKFR